jgi:hypothetical protein
MTKKIGLTSAETDLTVVALIDCAAKLEAEANDADVYGEPGGARVKRHKARQMRELASKVNLARNGE